jgi:hypothetical protein
MLAIWLFIARSLLPYNPVKDSLYKILRLEYMLLVHHLQIWCICGCAVPTLHLFHHNGDMATFLPQTKFKYCQDKGYAYGNRRYLMVDLELRSIYLPETKDNKNLDFISRR